MPQKIEAIRQRRREREYLATAWNAPRGPLVVMEPQKTLRDEFAMQALGGMSSAYREHWEIGRLAAAAYELADALLEARK